MDKFKVDKFDGGICDTYLSAAPNRYRVLDNLLINEDGRPLTRNGFFAFGTRIPTASGSTRVSGIYVDSEPYGRPIFIQGASLYAVNELGTLTEILGFSSHTALVNKTASDTESLVFWRKQLVFASNPATFLPSRVYCTTYSPTAAYRAQTLGLPDLGSTPAGTAGTPGTTFSYVYAFHYYLLFTDYDGTTFEEKGTVREVTVTSNTAIAAGAGNTISFTGIATLANTASTNYDTTNLKIRVSRTINNGTTRYFVADVSNGTTTYADTTTDAVLLTRDTLYTDGGALEYDQPPAGTRYVAQVNDFFWYATDKVITCSIQGAAGACPVDFQNPMDQKIRGLSDILSFPILFCDRSIYRIEGNFDEFGNNGYDLKEISKTAGCVSNRSIVKVPGGLVWTGNGGFYFTDGYSVKKISHDLDDTYEIWNNQNICGTYDSLRNIVYWTVNSSIHATTSPNDAMACLFLNFGLRDSSSFGTLSFRNNIFPSAIAFSESYDVPTTYRSKLLVADNRGYFLYMDDRSYTDPLINTDVYPSEFKKKAIIYRYESVGLDLGDDSYRKWCTHITTEMENTTDIALQYYSRRDDGGPWAALSELRQDGAILWQISEYGWNDTTDLVDHDWNSQSVTEGMRHMPSGTLRSTRRQLAFTNSKSWITKSDDKGTVTTNTALGFKTITLNTVTQFWPGDCEEYEILFASDAYTAYYKVKSRDSDTQITVYDPYGTLPSGSTLAWQMRGYRKFERANVLSFTVHFDGDGATQQANHGTTGLINA